MISRGVGGQKGPVIDDEGIANDNKRSTTLDSRSVVGTGEGLLNRTSLVSLPKMCGPGGPVVCTIGTKIIFRNYEDLLSTRDEQDTVLKIYV